MRDTPELVDVLPPEAIAFAEAANPKRKADEADTAHRQEGKITAPLRLTPSVQQRIRRVTFNQSEKTGHRVTAQDFMESAVMDRLEREEKKLGLK